MLYKKRKYFNNISENVGKVLSKFCPYPNAWTIFAIIPAILTSYFLVNQSFLVAASLFALTAVVDFIDGSVARTMKRVSNFGAYLDTVVDRITEFIVLAGLFFVNYPDFILPTKFWVFLFLFGSLMTTYVKAAAYEKKIVNKEVKGGLLERGERMILLFLIILFSAFIPEYAVIILTLTSLASITTAFQRFFIALKQWGAV